MRHTLYLTLAVLACCACGPKKITTPPRTGIPPDFPQSVGIITFLGDGRMHNDMTDQFAIGLAMQRFYPVHRILVDIGPDHRTRQVAGNGMLRTMWYDSLMDSLARMPESAFQLQGIFVGSFAGIAVTVDEGQVFPTGILHVQLLDSATRNVLWEVEIQDQSVFPSTLSLRASVTHMVKQALEQLRQDLDKRWEAYYRESANHEVIRADPAGIPLHRRNNETRRVQSGPRRDSSTPAKQR